MKYQGGKHTIADEIVGAMRAIVVPRVIVEPFMGGGNMTAALGRAFPSADIFAGERDPSVRAMWSALLAGWKPPEEHVGRAAWEALRDGPPCKERGWYGIAASMNGLIFSSYGEEFRGVRHSGAAEGKTRHEDYVKQTANAVLRQLPHMTRVDVVASDYQEHVVDAGDVVYCDPPYAGTLGYGGALFDSPAFWSWCFEVAARGAHVFVSEYTAPEGVRCVWTKEKAVTARISRNGKHRMATERLFYVPPTITGAP